jgi:mutator protein MutT
VGAFKAAMAVVINESEEALLLKRFGDSNWMPYKWGIPGGHIEKGETPKEAAIRETREETSLQLGDVSVLKEKNDVMIYYSNSFTGEVKLDREHTDWAWVPYNEIGSYDTTPNLNEIIKLALDKLQ